MSKCSEKELINTLKMCPVKYKVHIEIVLIFHTIFHALFKLQACFPSRKLYLLSGAPSSSSPFRRRQSQLIKVGRCFLFYFQHSSYLLLLAGLYTLSSMQMKVLFMHFTSLQSPPCIYLPFFSSSTFNKSSLSINTHGFGSRIVLLCMQPQNLVCLQQIDTQAHTDSTNQDTVILESRHQLGK